MNTPVSLNYYCGINAALLGNANVFCRTLVPEWFSAIAEHLAAAYAAVLTRLQRDMAVDHDYIDTRRFGFGLVIRGLINDDVRLKQSKSAQ